MKWHDDRDYGRT